MFDTLQNSLLTKEDIIKLLSLTGEEQQRLCDDACAIKLQHVGNKVWLRGLIELSNLCEKDCYYCGIRRSNDPAHRYILSHNEVMQAVNDAYAKGYGSVAIQSGEISTKAFINTVDKIVKEIKKNTHGTMGVTLSCGEQTKETYRRWFESGADRYLLRIETSSAELYQKVHPHNEKHSHSQRINALQALRRTGYQVGTGVMIGLPFQTTGQLADDLLFMKQLDIDMCGMGPYIENSHTPLFAQRKQLLPLTERFNLSLKMVAVLRLLMPDINIAATTALQAIHKGGREKAISAGANVLMPNITPKQYRDNYFLYDGKPLSVHSKEDELALLEQRLRETDHEIGYFQQGNSLHYKTRIQ
jgi:biotin synthase